MNSIADRPVFPLYDFSNYTSISTEDIPSAGSRDEMKYYWESSHFKAEVGDLVLSRIFNVGVVPKGFGVRLDRKTIETELTNIRAQQQIYRTSNEEDVARLQQDITDYKKKHDIRD